MFLVWTVREVLELELRVLDPPAEPRIQAGSWCLGAVLACFASPTFKRSIVGPGELGSVAATGPHHHVLVLLQYDVGVVVKVEHGDGVELGGGAARLRDVLRVHQVHLKKNRINSPFNHTRLVLMLT